MKKIVFLLSMAMFVSVIAQASCTEDEIKSEKLKSLKISLEQQKRLIEERIAKVQEAIDRPAEPSVEENP